MSENKDETEYIKIKVVDIDINGSDFCVKMYMWAQMSRLKKLFAEHVGVAVSSLEFLLNGQVIPDHWIIKELGMEQDDVIEVYRQQPHQEVSSKIFLNLKSSWLQILTFFSYSKFRNGIEEKKSQLNV